MNLKVYNRNRKNVYDNKKKYGKGLKMRHDVVRFIPEV